jgi:teichuronic acid biosynthesis protein TuaE
MKNTKNITSLHNFWLEILVEGGIIAFLIFIYFYFSTIYKVFVISKKTENETLMYYAKASTLALSIFIIAEISMSSAIYFLPMWLLLGFSLSLSKIYKL